MIVVILAITLCSGEIFQNYTDASLKNKPEQHIFSVHEGEKLYENEKKSLFKCVSCFHKFDWKEKLKRHIMCSLEMKKVSHV